MPAPRIVVVVNPRSQAGALGRKWSFLAAQLRREIGAFEDVLTRAPGDATRLAREAIDSGANTVVAIGGDGTINEVMNGFFEDGVPLETDTALGVLPFGVGLWVQVTRSATWAQPASGLGGEAATLSFPNLGLTVEIPAGALPPGVSPDDIVARNARTSDSGFTQEGVPIQIDGWPVLSAVTLEPAGLTFLQPVTVSAVLPTWVAS